MAGTVQVVIDRADPARLAEFRAEAREAASAEMGEFWIVLQDPEGNEFCVQ